MAMILGKKIGMTQVYDEEGRIVPVTVIQAGPCKVMQVKTSASDGYNAVQLGYDDVKASRIKKPAQGHAQKANATPKRYVREWRMDAETERQPGDEISVKIFEEMGITMVDVSAASKGKGYAGVMKRHGFGGFPASHGTERKHRAPGSIGGHATDRGHSGKIKKGKRMSGRMGNVRVTTKNHQLISVDEEKNLIVIKGPVPGPAGGYVEIRGSKHQPGK